MAELDPEMQSFFENEVAAVRERVKGFGAKRASAVKLIVTLLLLDMEVDQRGPLLTHLCSIYLGAGDGDDVETISPQRH